MFNFSEFLRSMGGLLIPIAMTISGIYLKERSENKKWGNWLPLYPYFLGIIVTILLNYPGFLRKSYYGVTDYGEPYIFSESIALFFLVLNYTLLIGGYLFIKKKAIISKEKKEESRFSVKRLSYLLYLIIVLHLISFVLLHVVYWSARFFQIHQIKSEFIEQTKLNFMNSEEIKLKDVTIDVISYDNPVRYKKTFDLIVSNPSNVAGYLEYLTARYCTQIESSSYDQHIDINRYISKSNELVGLFSDNECIKYLREFIPKYKTILDAKYIFYDEFNRLQIGYNTEVKINDIRKENKIEIEKIIVNFAKDFLETSCVEKEPFKYGIFAVSSDNVVVTGVEIDHSNCDDDYVRNVFSSYKFSKKELEFLKMESPSWFSSTLNMTEGKLVPFQK